MAVAALAFGGPVSSASAADGTAATPIVKEPDGEATGSSPGVALTKVPPEHRGFVVLRSIVESPRFADTYAGEVGREDGGTIVYATRPGIAELARALERELGSPAAASYELRPVARSYKALDALTQRIAGEARSLARDGIQLVMWGPDPATNTVKAEIADYTPARAEVITNRFGDNVRVVAAESDELMHAFALNRFYDSPYFYNGVALRPYHNAPYRCTHSFVVRGQWSGKKYGLTAGHCGGDEITTHESVAFVMGHVSTNYHHLQRDGGWDLESFTCDACSTTGFVWADKWANRDQDGVVRRVSSEVCTWCDRVLAGDLRERVAVDGAIRGEIRHNAVVTRDTCFAYYAYEHSEPMYKCHLNRVRNHDAWLNRTRVCGRGDSGGPVYQREASSDLVYAAGVLVGGDDTGTICVYHDMSRVLRMTNTDLISPVEPTP